MNVFAYTFMHINSLDILLHGVAEGQNSEYLGEVEAEEDIETFFFPDEGSSTLAFFCYLTFLCRYYLFFFFSFFGCVVVRSSSVKNNTLFQFFYLSKAH